MKTRVILFAVTAALAAVLIVAPAVHLAREPHPARYDRLAPIADLEPADAAVAQKLRDLLAFGAERLLQSSRDRASVAVFYHMRGFAPLWVEGGAPNPRALAAQDYLAAVSAEGLDPNDYAPLDAPAGRDAAALAADLAAAELRFTATILQYARDAQNGRVPFTSVSADVDYPRSVTKARDILTVIAQSADVATTLGEFNPPHEGYRALRRKLAQLRAGGPDGATSSASRSMLNQVDIVVANLERWRWLPRDLGNDHVVVNIPDYALDLMHNGTPLFRTKVVVGAPDLPTPLLSAAMTSITVNPIWNIPASLIENEYLPALVRDPGLAERMGLKIERGSSGKVRIYQPPGDDNVLGRIRFNFPNRFQVYQHDTNERSLFAEPAPDSSHGCIRVEKPFAYAAALLAIAAPEDGYSEDRLRSLIGDREVVVPLAKPIPVHLTYQTAFVDAQGDLVFRDDIYALDSRTLAALHAPRVKTGRDGGTTLSATQDIAQSKFVSP